MILFTILTCKFSSIVPNSSLNETRMTTSINSEAQTNRGMDKKAKWVIVEQMFLTMKKQRDNMQNLQENPET